MPCTYRAKENKHGPGDCCCWGVAPLRASPWTLRPRQSVVTRRVGISYLRIARGGIVQAVFPISPRVALFLELGSGG